MEEISGDAALLSLGRMDLDGEFTRAEYDAFAEAATELSFALPLHAPPPSLKGRLMARIAAEARAAQPSPMVVVRSGETPWTPGPVPGMEVRKLRKKTMLVRLAPGARAPMHHHETAEQCLVLEGSLSDGEVTVHAGDYVFMPAGTTHRELSTQTGCTFLIAYA